METDSRLIRAIGVRRLTAGIVNVTIGAGIFALPSVVAAGLGSAAPVAYIVCAAAMALIVTCFASAGSRVSLTGGLYAYTQVAFGPFVGYLCGVLLWLSCTLAVASVAAALADSMGVAIPAVAAGPVRAVFLVLLFGTLALVNIRGVTPGARLVEAVTAAKLIPLALLIVAGLRLLPLLPDAAPAQAGLDGLGRTSLVLIFAFLGIELALVPSGEVREPARTVPRAVFCALAITTVVYLLLQMVVQAALGAEITTFAAAPLAEAGARLLGGWGRSLILTGAAISMFGYVSGDMLGTPRVIFAFARDGFLPSSVASVHPRLRTPWVAIGAHAVVAASLAITSGFTRLVLLTNLSSLSVYLLCVAASYELQRRDVRIDGTPFRLAGGPLVPALAAGVIVWLLWQATREEFLLQGIVLALATAVYFVRRTITSMAHQNPSDDELRQLLTSASTIAMVGASGNPDKASHGIMKKLQSVGYTVIPINPREPEVLGARSYASLRDVPGKIDIVDVFRRPEDTPAIADEAVAAGARALWLQTGIANEEAAERAKRGGLMVVMDACISATGAYLRIPRKN